MNRAVTVCVVGALIALTGCTAWFQPVPAPTPTPTSTDARAEFDPERPALRIDLSCADIVERLDLATHLPGAVLRDDPAAELLQLGDSTISDAFVIAQARGLTCDWSPTSAISQHTRVPEGYSGLQVDVLPYASALWIDAVAAGAQYEGSPWCSAYESGANDCFFEGQAGEHWLRIRATNIDLGTWESDQDLTDAEMPFLSQIIEVVQAAPKISPAPQRHARTLPSDCEQILPVAAVNAVGAFGEREGYADSLTFGQRAGSMAGAAAWAIGAPSCSLVGLSEFTPYMEILPGGSWALYETLDDPAPAAGPAVPVKLAGLHAGDGAWSRCSEGWECELHLDLGGNWVQLSVSNWGPELTAEERTTLLEALTDLGAVVVEQVGQTLD